MKHSLLFLAGGLLLAGTAHAQVTFSVGPRVGLSLSTVHFASNDNTTGLRPGFEAGLQSSLQWGHFAFQPAVLYTQRGFAQDFNSDIDPGFSNLRANHVRLNYLSIPLLLAFTQRKDGTGFQVFAGPYVSMLLGGHRELDFTTGSTSDRVVAADRYEGISPSYNNFQLPDYTYYSRRFDVGVQGGVGYRLGQVMLQLTYGLGLRNLSSQKVFTIGPDTYTSEDTAYRNRSLQASLTYLFGSKG